MELTITISTKVAKIPRGEEKGKLKLYCLTDSKMTETDIRQSSQYQLSALLEIYDAVKKIVEGFDGTEIKPL